MSERIAELVAYVMAAIEAGLVATAKAHYRQIQLIAKDDPEVMADYRIFFSVYGEWV